MSEYYSGPPQNHQYGAPPPGVEYGGYPGGQPGYTSQEQSQYGAPPQQGYYPPVSTLYSAISREFRNARQL